MTVLDFVLEVALRPGPYLLAIERLLKALEVPGGIFLRTVTAAVGAAALWLRPDTVCAPPWPRNQDQEDR